MGTSTSTRWNGHERKRHTSEFLAIPLWRLASDHPVLPGDSRESRWDDVAPGENIFMISVTLKGVSEDRMDAEIFVLHSSSGQHGSFSVDIQCIPLRNGGFDWQAACPGDSGAPHSAKILYLDHGLKILACRACHDLTYASRMHDKALDGINSELKSDRAAAQARIQKMALGMIRDADKTLKKLKK